MAEETGKTRIDLWIENDLLKELDETINPEVQGNERAHVRSQIINGTIEGFLQRQKEPMMSELLKEIDQVSEEKRHPLGTRLETGRYPYRYAQAGDDLKRGFPAFSHYEGEPAQDTEGHFIIGREVIDALWGDIRPEGEKGQLVGWPPVNVAKGLFFWLRELL